MRSKYELVRSPLNYTGAKFRQMPIILDHLPNRMRIFRDSCAGGGNVFANVWPNKNVKQIQVADIDAGVLAQLIEMGYQDPIQFVREVREEIKEHGLSRASKKEYYAYRASVNSGELPLNGVRFMVLISHAYNNMIRWNAKGEFNVPFGKRTFNAQMRDNTFAFINRLNRIPNLTYFRRDFRRLSTRFLTAEDLVFYDPPYLTGHAAYNAGWTEKDESDLLCKLDILDARGVKFMLINAVENRGETNRLLLEWMPKYKVVEIDQDYSGAYRATRKGAARTREVLVMNYDQE